MDIAKRLRTILSGKLEENAERRIVIGYGRFNPPSIDHEIFLNTVKEQANGEEYRIYLSQSCDPLKNPLDLQTKYNLMCRMFPEHADKFVCDNNIHSFFDVLKSLNTTKYGKIDVVVGENRISEFQNLTLKYNKKLYSFSEVNFIPSPDRKITSSRMRKSIVENDYETFRSGLPENFDEELSLKYFEDLRKSISCDEPLWKIAPKLDSKSLRENYIDGSLFPVGSIVENLNTGLIGKVIRRGANHIICITKEGYLFKSWIKDLNEVHEIGTDSYREYVQRLTPREKIQSFINKSRNTSKIKRR